jgi:hypothetical protein
MVQLCMVKGIVIKSLPKNEADEQPQFEHMAISLFSTPFPQDKYDHAKILQKPLGQLLGKMITDPVRCIHEKLSFFYGTDPFL